jgi:hypothetical protein
MGWLWKMNSLKFLFVLLLINVNQIVNSSSQFNDGASKINETTSLTTTNVDIPSSTTRKSLIQNTTEQQKGKMRKAFKFRFLDDNEND